MASTAIVIMGGFDQAIPEKTPVERLLAQSAAKTFQAETSWTALPL
jgi:hypothetical protein